MLSAAGERRRCLSIQTLPFNNYGLVNKDITKSQVLQKKPIKRTWEGNQQNRADQYPSGYVHSNASFNWILNLNHKLLISLNTCSAPSPIRRISLISMAITVRKWVAYPRSINTRMTANAMIPMTILRLMVQYPWLMTSGAKEEAYNDAWRQHGASYVAGSYDILGHKFEFKEKWEGIYIVNMLIKCSIWRRA